MVTDQHLASSYSSHMNKNLDGKYPVDVEYLNCLHQSFITTLDQGVDQYQLNVLFKEFKQKNEQIRRADIMLYLQHNFDQILSDEDGENSHLIKTIESLIQLQKIAQRDYKESKHKTDLINFFIVKTLKTRYGQIKVSHKLSEDNEYQLNEMKEKIKNLKTQLEKSEKERQIYLQQIDLLSTEINEQNLRVEKVRKESTLMQLNLEQNLNKSNSNNSLIDEKTRQQLLLKEKQLKIDTLKTKKKKYKFQLKDLQSNYDALLKNYNMYQQENLKAFTNYQLAQEKLKTTQDKNKTLENQMKDFSKNQNQNHQQQSYLQQQVHNQRDQIEYQQKALHGFSLQKDQLLKDVSQSFVNFHKQKIQDKLDINNLKNYQVNLSCHKSSAVQRLNQLNISRGQLSISQHHKQMNLSPDKTLEKSFLNVSTNEEAIFKAPNTVFGQSRLLITETFKNNKNREQMSHLFKNLSFRKENSSVQYALFQNRNNHRYNQF